MKIVRCAIYTRKSSDEGLEQGFNSLDAQREACAAYVRSQASEGWVALSELYDDGGISGGTLERPALKRLLADVSSGKVDVIVVYKVDRLSRSLFDFAKLVEVLEKASCSFVSITQPISTTTSMGRLTLNMLLSFAQFEREVTAERIRDKIAASKAKGMWMGGVPPIGYQPDGRSLGIVEEEATLIRHIFERYLALPHVNALASELEREGKFTPQRTTLAKRTALGGAPFARGQLYVILKNPTYVAEVHYQGNIYPALHPPIIDRALWDQVQAKLADHTQGPRKWERAGKASLLGGKVVDEVGEVLVPAHSVKTIGDAKRRYSYYVSRALHHGKTETRARIPARELESAVATRLAEALDDPLTLADRACLEILPVAFVDYSVEAALIAARVRKKDTALTRTLISQVRVLSTSIEIVCDQGQLAELLKVEVNDVQPIVLTLPIRLARSGMAMRLIQGGLAQSGDPERSLIRLVCEARQHWAALREGKLNMSEYAASKGVGAPYMTRMLRLAFLSPKLIDEILAGKQPAGMTGSSMMQTGAVAPLWSAQASA